jgi:predicted metalloprotease with PDZ domain
LDMIIRKNSEGKYSLDDVMRELYYEYAKRGKGYTADDYKNIVEKFAGISLTTFFNDYVNGVKPYDEALKTCLEEIGCEMHTAPSHKYNEAHYGFKVIEGQPDKVTSIYPGSIAENAGLYIGDDILAINSIPVKGNLAEWCKYFAGQKIELTVLSSGLLKNVTLVSSAAIYFKRYSIVKSSSANDAQKKIFQAWSGRRF